MFIADLHIHSSYSRATSRDCSPEMLDMWARRKGLDLIGTGDFTHPAWRDELRQKLVPAEQGMYMLKEEFRKDCGVASADAPRFVVSGEISSIYKKNGKTRKVHNLILLPGIQEAENLSRRLEAIGNLHSDGRPILGLDSRDLLEISLEVCPDVIFIPAHIWTPHFSLFGAYSGFDDIEECFEDLTCHIHALETGLSSDPPMNWRLSALDRFAMVSNSDAHSPANLAREANIFNTGLSYRNIAHALENPHEDEFHGTLEFFPEEGKYHSDGHRNCKVCFKPGETLDAKGVCPVCGGRITVGVLHRINELADRPEGYIPPGSKHFESLVPLRELIASALGVGSASKKVKEKYEEMLRSLGTELFIIRKAPLEDIALAAGPIMAEGIRRLRCGQVKIQPGYDGEYGRIQVIDKAEIAQLAGQLDFFVEVKEQNNSGQRQGMQDKYDIHSGPQAEQAKDDDKAPAMNNPYGLNEMQWKAVSSDDSAVVVVAGPGTGKTRTLVSRIAYMVEQRNVPPNTITAVTFTNKAAAQMRERLNAQFGNKKTARAINIGTFYSICLKFLSKKRNDFVIIDENDALYLLKDILAEKGVKESPREALRRISLVKSGAASIENMGSLGEVYDAYNIKLAEYGVLDFDDVLLRALEAFESGGINGTDAFTHLMVDEFQDINAIQYRLIQEWGMRGESLFAIGDPDQSIYGFRGSDPRCFEQLFADYPHARRVELTQNYRSTPQIIRCAKSLRLHEGSLEAVREEGTKVRLLHAESAFSEAVFVAKEIGRMVGGVDMLGAHNVNGRRKARAERQRGLSDIAVLYRTNRQARVLEQCLKTEGIPYVVAGRGDFLDDPHVRSAIAFFRCLMYPGDRVSARICKADDGLLERYKPLVGKENPAALINAWIEDKALRNESAMEALMGAALMYGSMADMLQALALGRESDVLRSGSRHYDTDSVSLMTLHAAKGLEFPVVFLCGMNKQMMPYQSRGGGCDPEEEKRLLYVGMTRAEEELILLSPGETSAFLDLIPEKEFVREEALPHREPRSSVQISLFDD